jgi:selenide,water dikinase
MALASVPFGPGDKMAADLFAMLEGASRVLRAAGAVLMGGHSAEAAELALGFAVNGFARPDRLLRKSGLRVGDALVLTRPIGTGVLFAAEMRGRAKARWIEAALAQMVMSAAAASACLIEHNATGCTDVTGFGLAGHLVEMAEGSGVGIVLNVGSVPMLDGALELASQGLKSSLQGDNRRVAEKIVVSEDFAAKPQFAMLFDPQTAGGLLAGITADRAAECIAGLHRIGHVHAAIIGRVIKAAPGRKRIECNEF